MKTESTRPPRTTRSAGSSPRATASRRARWTEPPGDNRTVPRVDVLTPRTLDEALRLSPSSPTAVPIQGGTDLMVALNFDRSRPEAILNLNEVAELRGWSRENGSLRLGAGLTYTEAMRGELAELLPALAEASRTVGSPQIRNRGTIGGNLGTASPAGDALPPLARSRTPRSSARRCAARAAFRSREFVTGVKRNALAPDELIAAIWVTPSRGAADVHEGRAAQRDGDRGRAPSRSCRARRRAARRRSGRQARAPSS